MSKKNKLITTSSDWTFKTLQDFDKVISKIAKKDLKLDTYSNQVEIVTSEQMIDAYSLVGLPISYTHWSFGKSFMSNSVNYQKGRQGLAYELVINSNPCISYNMEDNTSAMMALVLAHAAYGHNSFFKNNYMFKEWTDADSIINDMVYARDFISKCEEKYGVEEVESVLDACHALQRYGVDKKHRPRKKTKKEKEARRKKLLKIEEENYNVLWETLPEDVKKSLDMKNKPKDKDKLAEDNILYFIENNSPNLPLWKREIIRIVRNVGQYFYPQSQTNVVNEGWACVHADTLIDTEFGLIKAKEIVDKQYINHVHDGGEYKKVTNWFFNPNKKRIKIKTKQGYEIYGGYNHKILVDDEWVELKDIEVGQKIKLERGDDKWNDKYYFIDYIIPEHRHSICEVYDTNTTTYRRYRDSEYKFNMTENNIDKCRKVEEFMDSQSDLSTMHNKRELFKVPMVLDEDLATWLGLMIGDGNISDKKRIINLTTGDDEIKDWFVEKSKELFDLEFKVKKDGNRWRIFTYNQNLKDFLINEFNLKVGKSAGIKEIPNQILTSPKSVVSAFLRGYFDADGCATKTGNVILVSKSISLISTTQQLLLKMGIMSSSQERKDGTHALTMGGIDVKLFNQHVGFNLNRKTALIENWLDEKKWFLQKKDMVEVIEIIEDEGPTYDFSVEDTHKYKASGFINHNCFVHHYIMNKMYDEGYIDEGFMLEFIKSHSNVLYQPPYNSKRFRGLNPYTLGFNIFQDIKRMCENPTEEDYEYFPNIAGKDWLEQVHFAMENFRNDTFILQYLSPKVIRDMKLFLTVDLEDDDEFYHVNAVHTKRDYNAIREALSKQYQRDFHIPTIQVTGVDKYNENKLTLTHKIKDGRLLDEDEALETLLHMQQLWPFPIELKSKFDSGEEITIVDV